MPAQHGGSRPRAGRKRKATKYELAVTEAEDKIVDHLPAILDNLLELANGGYERVVEEWQPAGLVTLTRHDEEKDAFYQVQAFPDKDPDELVLIKRSVSVADKDRAANIYLMDRILGKPTQKQDIDIHGKGINVTVRHITHAPSE